MSPLVRNLLREVDDAGGHLRLDGSNLLLSAPAPLPDALRHRLRCHKAEIVALLSVDGSRCAGENQAEHGCSSFEQRVPEVRTGGFDWIFDAYRLDPWDDEDRMEAARIWMGMPTGPPADDQS